VPTGSLSACGGRRCDTWRDVGPNAVSAEDIACWTRAAWRDAHSAWADDQVAELPGGELKVHTADLGELAQGRKAIATAAAAAADIAERRARRGRRADRGRAERGVERQQGRGHPERRRGAPEELRRAERGYDADRLTAGGAGPTGEGSDSGWKGSGLTASVVQREAGREARRRSGRDGGRAGVQQGEPSLTSRRRPGGRALPQTATCNRPFPSPGSTVASLRSTPSPRTGQSTSRMSPVSSAEA
jgi:hypothetical protein